MNSAASRMLRSFRRLVGLELAGRKRPVLTRRLGLEPLEDRTVLSTLLVNPSGLTPTGNIAYTTIQAAVNAASAGDTIVVDPGTYTENVTIPANDGGLTLQGAKSGVNPVPGRSGPESVLNGTIAISAAGVTVDGFKIIANSQWAVFTSGINSVLQNNIVTNNQFYGIQVQIPAPQDNPVSSVILNNVLSVSTLGSDIYLFRSSNNTVRGNSIRGGAILVLTSTSRTIIPWNPIT